MVHYLLNKLSKNHCFNGDKLQDIHLSNCLYSTVLRDFSFKRFFFRDNLLMDYYGNWNFEYSDGKVSAFRHFKSFRQDVISFWGWVKVFRMAAFQLIYFWNDNIFSELSKAWLRINNIIRNAEDNKWVRANMVDETWTFWRREHKI